MKTACVALAEGCPRSEVDTRRLTEYLKANQWEITNKFQKTDLVLIGTCGYNKFSEERSLKFIANANKKMRKDARRLSLVDFLSLE